MREEFQDEWQYQGVIICLFCLFAQARTQAPEQWSDAEDGLITTVAFTGSSFLNPVFYGFISGFICCPTL